MYTGDVGLGLASMQGGKRVHGLSVRGGRVHEHDVWSNKRKAKIWCDLDEGRDEKEGRDENVQGSWLQRRVRNVLAAALS
jgi:hypothetical protein